MRVLLNRENNGGLCLCGTTSLIPCLELVLLPGEGREVLVLMAECLSSLHFLMGDGVAVAAMIIEEYYL